MMLELHNVCIGERLKGLSLTVDGGRPGCITGGQGVGKTTLLRALLGMLPVDEGHISIDGELLTPLSAAYFRRYIAYAPQHLEVMEGYDTPAALARLLTGLKVNKAVSGKTATDNAQKERQDTRRWQELSADERYLLLLRHALLLGKPLLLVDEPPQGISNDTRDEAATLLTEASRHGTAVLCVNIPITQNLLRL